MIICRMTRLHASASRVWEELQRLSTFAYVASGLLGFRLDGPVEDRFVAGHVYRGRLWLGHIVPAWQHQIKIIRVDAGSREILTNESGGPLRVWNHRLSVAEESADSCLYTDEIELDAGWLTLPTWVMADLFFRYRQARWRRLAARLA